MSRAHWSDTDDPTRFQRGLFGSVASWIVAFVVLIGLISAALWAFGVFSSGPKGRGDQIRRQNSEANRTFQQQHFEDLYADYQSSLVKIPSYVVAAKGGDNTATTNLLGLRSHCTDVASTYNQDSQKVLASDPNGNGFKTADLPVSLDLSMCQES